MKISRFLTRALALFTRTHRCHDGPMAGETVVLSEHSKASAWLEVRGEIGRYVEGDDGRLHWERMV